jgi:hypothetical protein
VACNRLEMMLFEAAARRAGEEERQRAAPAMALVTLLTSRCGMEMELIIANNVLGHGFSYGAIALRRALVGVSFGA